MLKAYQDAVFSYGFAFGAEGDKLHGKQFKIVTTTGGADYAYQAGGWNNFTMSELLRPLQQTANLTGMVYTRPFILHGVLVMDNATVKENVQAFKEELKDNDWGDGLTKYLAKMDDSTL
jgi:glutathione-regulated potassium-efflux system ancillary protein KefG